jgi:hypothetical protein
VHADLDVAVRTKPMVLGKKYAGMDIRAATRVCKMEIPAVEATTGILR